MIGERIKAAAALAALLAPFVAAHAEGLAYEVSVGTGTTDNVTRQSTFVKDETIANAGLKVSYDKLSKRVEANLAGDLAYYDYLNGTYDSDVIGNFAGETDVALVLDRVHWITSDYFGQVLGDSFAPSTPENRENLNYFTTGLNANFNFGAQLRFDVGAAYSLTTYENSPLDSTNLIGDIGLTRLISDASEIGLFARQGQLEYEDAISSGSDYDQTEGFLRYSGEGGRTKLATDVGYSRIERNVAGTDSGFLLRLNVARALSSRSTLSLSAGQEFSNSGAAFSASLSGGALSLDTNAARQAADPFTYRYASLIWSASGTRTGLSLTGSWREQIYEDQTELDQSLVSLGVSVRRDLSPAVNVQLDATYATGKFEQAGVDYSDTLGRLQLQWRMSRRLALSVAYYYGSRGSDAPGGDYTENQLWLLLGYQHGLPRDTMRESQFSGDGS
jgi:hypothetical protein